MFPSGSSGHNECILALYAIIDYNDIIACTKGENMASLTIRNLDNNLKAQLRLRAAQHGCSMEAEVRSILSQSLLPIGDGSNFVVRIRKRFETLGGESLSIPPRQIVRTPPDFGE